MAPAAGCAARIMPRSTARMKRDGIREFTMRVVPGRRVTSCGNFHEVGYGELGCRGRWLTGTRTLWAPYAEREHRWVALPTRGK
jgi:hypothetical protein